MAKPLFIFSSPEPFVDFPSTSDSVDIPRWLRRRSPEPRVSIASGFLASGVTVPSLAAVAASSPSSGIDLMSSVVAVELLERVGLAIVLVRVLVMFCAAEKTEEKKPPPAEPDDDVRAVPPGVLLSSAIGVIGAGMACDNLLGIIEPESDRTRRCDIIFPEADTVMFEFTEEADNGRFCEELSCDLRR